MVCVIYVRVRACSRTGSLIGSKVISMSIPIGKSNRYSISVCPKYEFLIFHLSLFDLIFLGTSYNLYINDWTNHPW